MCIRNRKARLAWQDLARAFVMLGASSGALGGCSVQQYTVNRTVEIAERASHAVESHWDYDFVGQALPAGLLQIEGLLQLDPDNEILLLRLARGYSGYAFGWLEDQWERQERGGDLEEAERTRRRANAMHRKAWQYAVRALDAGVDGFYQARRKDKNIESWIDKHADTSFAAESLFWWATSLAGSARTAESPGLHMDKLERAQKLMQTSVAIDPSIEGGTGLVFLGAVAAIAPEPLGGDLKASQRYFDQARKVSGGKVLMVDLQYARSYAVAAEDRTLYIKTLKTILRAGDLSAEHRLQNAIARRRAERYITQTDELF